MKKVRSGALKIEGQNNAFSEDCAIALGDLVKGYPPRQIFIHRGKIYSDTFAQLHKALTKEGEVVIEVNKLETWEGTKIEDSEPDEIMMQATDLVNSAKFLRIGKKLGLDLETMHSLSMVASRIYETAFPVVAVDDDFDEGDLREYLHEHFVSF